MGHAAHLRVLGLLPCVHRCQFYSACVAGQIQNASDPRWSKSLVALDNWLSLIDTHFDATVPSFSDIWYLLGLLNGAQMGQGALLLQLTQGYLADAPNAAPAQAPVALRYESIAAFEVASYIHSQFPSLWRSTPRRCLHCCS